MAADRSSGAGGGDAILGPVQTMQEADLVAKRVRGQRATHRSGGQAAPQRRPSVPSVSRLSAGASADIDAAIDSVLSDEAELVVAEPVAPTYSSRPRRGARMRADSLEARIDAENVYVRQDLRRIAVVSALLFAALAVCWFLFVFLNVLDLY
jgi:hypothetical protein